MWKLLSLKNRTDPGGAGSLTPGWHAVKPIQAPRDAVA